MKVDLKNFEEYGIKEQEFSKLFKSEPVYTLTKFGKFLYGDFSEVLTLRKYKEMVRKLKTKIPEIRGFDCLLRLHGEDLEQGNL